MLFNLSVFQFHFKTSDLGSAFKDADLGDRGYKSWDKIHKIFHSF